MKIALKPALLRWARQRAGLSEEDLAHRVGVRQEKVVAWERDGILTFIEAEKLAKVTRTPFGYLYLNEPPHEELPIADYRRLTTEKEKRTSPDLLELLYIAQRRQDWFRDYLVSHGEKPLSFVGSVSVAENPAEVAGRIRETVGFDTEIRSAATTWGEALKLQIEQIENSGVLVMRSGIVGNNAKRKLSVEEFRGFALADPYAPLIFINAQDAKAAQMFTLVHELVHIWLGESGVSNLTRTYAPTTTVERFCNGVAAEALAPEQEFKDAWEVASHQTDPVKWLCRKYKLSALVILRRMHDLGLMPADTFKRMFEEQEKQFIKSERGGTGGDYYLTKRSRLGERFAKALIESTLEGETPYREAFRLLEINTTKTFHKLAERLQLVG